MICTGIDPGYRRGGIGTIRTNPGTREVHCVEVVTFATETSDGDFAIRGEAILRAVRQHLLTHKPEVVGIEEQERTLHGAQQRGQANAGSYKPNDIAHAIWGMCFQLGLRVHWVSPQNVKRAVGLKGNAKKDLVADAIRSTVQGLPKRTSEHARDALATGMAAELQERERRSQESERWKKQEKA